MWYEYTPGQTGLLQIQTTDSDLDTVVTVYDACFGAELACNDDAFAGSPVNYGTLQSYLSLPVLSGQDYFVRVAGYSGLQDNFRIRFDTDTGAPLCLGDGISGNDCPCNNHSATASEAGCINSTGNAGRLSATGTSDVSSDTVLLSGTGMPPGSTVLFFQGTGKVGAVGFCYGGGIAHMLATKVPDLAAAVPFYGNTPPPEAAATVKAPLLVHLAEKDERINAAWPAYEAALKAANVTYTAHVYAGAQHGFNNDTTPRYDEASAKLAWARTLEFFKANLR